MRERNKAAYEAGNWAEEARIFLGALQAALVASGHLSGPKRKGALLPFACSAFWALVPFWYEAMCVKAL